jgi:hypothetical protein
VRRQLLSVLCAAIAAAFHVRLAAAATATQDVPIPGGTAALAEALGIEPVPERGRFVAELTRLLYDAESRSPMAAAFLQEVRLRARAEAEGAHGTNGLRLSRPAPVDYRTFEVVPVPLSTAAWSSAVLHRRVAPEDLVVAILADRQAALLCHGLAALDDETLQFFADHLSLVSRIYERTSWVFAAFSGSLRIRANSVVPPGAPALWEAVVGEKVTRPERFIAALFEASDGRLAYLYDIAGHIDPARRAFMLGLWIDDPALRLARFKSLAGSGITAYHDWNVRTLPFGRAPHDLAMTLMHVAVDERGAPTPPSSRAFWTRVFAGADVRDDSPPAAIPATDDRPIDAAWLTETIASSDARQRGDRLDQLAFGQRLFATASPGEAAHVFAAIRGLVPYRMLMLALERIGVRAPSVYAVAARHAGRLALVDGSRGFVAQAQFQGAVALVARMAAVRTFDAAAAEQLLERLCALTLRDDGRYAGAVAGWIRDELGPAIHAGPDIDSAIVGALAGHSSAEPGAVTRLVWEGERYRLDFGFAERRRLQRVREKQRAWSIDLPLELSALARRLTSDALAAADVDAALARVAEIAAGLRRHVDAGVPDDAGETLRKSIDELTRISRNRDAKRAAHIAEPLVEAADALLAQALVSLSYAVHIGDPDGTVLLAGDVSYRHDFGLLSKDSLLRARSPWSLPRQDVSPGVPWHVSGSLLGLDVALAPLALRRISFDRLTRAPKLTSNIRDAFGISVAIMNPYELRDDDRDAIVEAIGRGRARVVAIMDADDAAERFDALADEVAVDGSRRRALRWMLAHEPDRFLSMFSLTELLFLGRPPAKSLDPWGMSVMATAGCICTRFVPPGTWWLLTGRPQLGAVAAGVADVNLHVAIMLKELNLPAALARAVLSAAMQDFIDEVRPTDDGDWVTLSRAARTATREQIEDYVATATADGPLVPDTQ